VEASLQASLIHTSASLVSPRPLPHRDPFNIAEGPASFPLPSPSALGVESRFVTVSPGRDAALESPPP
jgi:hypothetical protein